jgi:hypothetical protein
MSKRMNIATPRKSKDGKTFWTTIGTAWFNDNGGIQLVFDALPIPDGEGGLSPTCSSRASVTRSGDTRQTQPATADLDDDFVAF